MTERQALARIVKLRHFHGHLHGQLGEFDPSAGPQRTILGVLDRWVMQDIERAWFVASTPPPRPSRRNSKSLVADCKRKQAIWEKAFKTAADYATDSLDLYEAIMQWAVVERARVTSRQAAKWTGFKVEDTTPRVERRSRPRTGGMRDAIMDAARRKVNA